MMRTYLNAKIHRATVTEANLAYEGSVTIDQALMESANIQPYEAVHIWDVTNGARIETYAIPGLPGSGTICINGGAAHLIKANDLVVIASFVTLTADEAKAHQPRKIFVDAQNRVTNP